MGCRTNGPSDYREDPAYTSAGICFAASAKVEWERNVGSSSSDHGKTTSVKEIIISKYVTCKYAYLKKKNLTAHQR